MAVHDGDRVDRVISRKFKRTQKHRLGVAYVAGHAEPAYIYNTIVVSLIGSTPQSAGVGHELIVYCGHHISRGSRTVLEAHR